MRALVPAIACLAVAVVACHHEPVSLAPTNNPDVAVELLFEHDGCRVYRFWDVGAHYFARCDGAPGARPTATTITAGKVDENVPTIER